MNKQSIREIFDNISLSVISFLENHIGITDVEFTERQGNYNSLNPHRCCGGGHHEMGGGECALLAARRLQGLPLDFRRAQS